MSNKHIILDSNIDMTLGIIKILKGLADDYQTEHDNESELHNIIQNTYQSLSIQFTGIIMQLETCKKDVDDKITKNEKTI